MEGSRAGLLATRAIQIVFAVIVLGISAYLAKELDNFQKYCRDYESNDYCDYVLGRIPAGSDYATFTGVFGLIDAIVGLAACFVTAIPWVVVLGFDALATVFYLAGGINSAVLRGDGACHAKFCSEWTASTAFMFLGFFISAVAIGLVAIHRRTYSK